MVWGALAIEAEKAVVRDPADGEEPKSQTADDVIEAYQTWYLASLRLYAVCMNAEPDTRIELEEFQIEPGDFKDPHSFRAMVADALVGAHWRARDYHPMFRPGGSEDIKDARQRQLVMENQDGETQ